MAGECVELAFRARHLGPEMTCWRRIGPKMVTLLPFASTDTPLGAAAYDHGWVIAVFG